MSDLFPAVPSKSRRNVLALAAGVIILTGGGGAGIKGLLTADATADRLGKMEEREERRTERERDTRERLIRIESKLDEMRRNR